MLVPQTKHGQRSRAAVSRSRIEGLKRQIRTVIQEQARGHETAIELVSATLATSDRLRAFQSRIEELMRAVVAAEVIEDTLVGDIDRFSNDLLTQARISGEAKRSLLRDNELMTAADVSKLLGSKSENARQYANTRRQRGELLGVPRANQFFYPTFQFDSKRKTVYSDIEAINAILDAAHDPWGTLSWWVSPNARLGNRRAPRDLLGTKDASRLVSLAEAVVEPVG